MRVLVADDDRNILDTLEIALQQAGFTVQTAGNGKEAWDVFLSERPDFVVMDVSMPQMDGLTVLRSIRQHGDFHVPVILLTGKDAERDKVAALEMGADDYVTKPFSHRELTARIRAVWRRVSQLASTRVVTVGELSINPSTRELTKNGQHIDVTVNEFTILFMLMERVGEVVRTSTLMKQIWGGEVSNDLMRVTIFRLRRKIESDPKNPRYIQTVPGVGFILRGI